jgi:hypothetical protein
MLTVAVVGLIAQARHDLAADIEPGQSRRAGSAQEVIDV